MALQDTTNGGSFTDTLQQLLQYGGQSYIDKHLGYQEQPAPVSQPVQQATTQTNSGAASPNDPVGSTLNFVSKYQKDLIIVFGAILAGAVIYKVAT